MEQPQNTADKFADLLGSLHATRNQRQNAFRATKRIRQMLSAAERFLEDFLAGRNWLHVCAKWRSDGGRFVVHADEKLTVFLELESAIRSAEPLR
jgi:hypothetical protein